MEGVEGCIRTLLTCLFLCVALPTLSAAAGFGCSAKVIASLRRELGNLEVEAEVARAIAAAETLRRQEMENEVDALRCVLEYWAAGGGGVSLCFVGGGVQLLHSARWAVAKALGIRWLRPPNR